MSGRIPPREQITSARRNKMINALQSRKEETFRKREEATLRDRGITIALLAAHEGYRWLKRDDPRYNVQSKRIYDLFKKREAVAYFRNPDSIAGRNFLTVLKSTLRQNGESPRAANDRLIKFLFHVNRFRKEILLGWRRKLVTRA
ncbi:MAG: hypothetical protein V1776_02890 [Candidatus Diapherotrites archaeon]